MERSEESSSARVCLFDFVAVVPLTNSALPGSPHQHNHSASVQFPTSLHISYICSVTLITLASAAVIPDVGIDRRQDNAAISWRDCTWEKAFLEADFEEMRMLAKKAAENVDSNNAISTAFFGKEPSVTWIGDARIKKRYTAMSNFKSKPLRDTTIRCNTNIPACKSKHLPVLSQQTKGAQTSTSATHTGTPGHGVQSPGKCPHPETPRSTVHWMSTYPLDHNYCMNSPMRDSLIIINPATQRTEKAYSHRNTLLLARDSPQKAREKADNYKLFAIASYFDRNHWSVNPDRLSGDSGF
ncbi:hypothetical protein B9Z19DRAFT_1123801 [Tuber borchii]|uniref:Uncharacterized protein n=1 Tax=Tuber borchii TaxID=42251 RepID=A0A2T6ZXV2_TUBBO|nr:hypothetical protein B9Z19DRAFT_1123801 [Tuber borchii]